MEVSRVSVARRGGDGTRGCRVDGVITFGDADANQGDLLAVHRFHGRVGTLLVAEYDEAQLRVNTSVLEEVQQSLTRIAFFHRSRTL